MTIEVKPWNVIVVGAWNVAILTPDGIRKRLLDLPDGTPVEVEVAIDRPGPFRVVHDSLVVTPSSKNLEIATQRPEDALLLKACALADAALRSLPETPVFAAGVNMRRHLSSIPNHLIEMLKAPLDDVLSDRGETIKASVARKTLAFADGVANLEIMMDNDVEGVIGVNFHRSSNSVADLRSWLAQGARFVEFGNRLIEGLVAQQGAGNAH